MGEMTWPDQSKFVGEFKDSVRNGFGVATYTDGVVEKGIWENDVLVDPS